jgi:hypothetical protein
MLSKMLKTSESAGMEHAERHPVGGVVLTKITLEDEWAFRLSKNSEARISSPWCTQYHILRTAFGCYQAEAPKWAAKLPPKATEVNAGSGYSIMVHASVVGFSWRKATFGSRLDREASFH